VKGIIGYEVALLEVFFFFVIFFEPKLNFFFCAYKISSSYWSYLKEFLDFINGPNHRSGKREHMSCAQIKLCPDCRSVKIHWPQTCGFLP